jgi:hypothetical protein
VNRLHRAVDPSIVKENVDALKLGHSLLDMGLDRTTRRLRPPPRRLAWLPWAEPPTSPARVWFMNAYVDSAVQIRPPLSRIEQPSGLRAHDLRD